MSSPPPDVSQPPDKSWLARSISWVFAALCVVLGLVWLLAAPNRPLQYVLNWDTTGIEPTEEGWSFQGGTSTVVLTEFELVSYSVELMPCPGSASAASEMSFEVLKRIVPAAHAGHSGVRNPMATPFAVIENPLEQLTLTLQPASVTPGDWCRAHWLVARRDEDTLVARPTNLPDRRSLYIAGYRLIDGSREPFSFSSTLANGRYFELPERTESAVGGDIVVQRSAEALMRALELPLAPRDRERAVLRALFDSATVSLSDGRP